MVESKINQDFNEESFTKIIGSEAFLNLSTDTQNKIIGNMYNDRGKDGGSMGKFLGVNPNNASIHIGFILCILLIIIVVIDFIHSYWVGQNVNLDVISAVIPVITLYFGYIFGKSSK